MKIINPLSYTYHKAYFFCESQRIFDENAQVTVIGLIYYFKIGWWIKQAKGYEIVTDSYRMMYFERSAWLIIS